MGGCTVRVLKIGPIRNQNCLLLNSIHEVRRFVDTYFEQLNGDVAIGDLSHLSKDAQAVLLKFIEEGVGDITCHASRDSVSPVLMSRFDSVVFDENMRYGRDGFEYFLKHIENKERIISIERDFLSKAGDYLDTYLFYKRLPKPILSRMSRLL